MIINYLSSEITCIVEKGCMIRLSTGLPELFIGNNSQDDSELLDIFRTVSVRKNTGYNWLAQNC